MGGVLLDALLRLNCFMRFFMAAFGRMKNGRRKMLLGKETRRVPPKPRPPCVKGAGREADWGIAAQLKQRGGIAAQLKQLSQTNPPSPLIQTGGRKPVTPASAMGRRLVPRGPIRPAAGDSRRRSRSWRRCRCTVPAGACTGGSGASGPAFPSGPAGDGWR